MNHAAFIRSVLDADQPVPPGLSDGRASTVGNRFNVYRNNIGVSLTDALADAFPVVRMLVGEEFFRAMASIALRQHPPATPVLAEYGQDFPRFLERFEPAATLPYLADVARVENAVRRAYHAADSPPLTPDAFAAIPVEQLGELMLGLVPAATLVRSSFPVASIWLNHQPNAEKQALSGSGEDLVISRPGFDPAVDLLPPGAHAFLSHLNDNRPLGEALEAAPGGFDFGTTLTLCLNRGLLRITDHLPAPAAN